MGTCIEVTQNVTNRSLLINAGRFSLSPQLCLEARGRVQDPVLSCSGRSRGAGSCLRHPPARPGEHCCPVPAAPMALLIFLHRPPPKPQEGRRRFVWCPKGEESPSSAAPVWEEQGLLQPTSHLCLPRPATCCGFQRKGISRVHSALAGLFPCGLISQPHPWLTWAGSPTANALPVLSKCLFSQPQRESRFAMSLPRPASSWRSRWSDPDPIQESKSRITSEKLHGGGESLQSETQDSSVSSSGNPEGSGLGITYLVISSCLALYPLCCHLHSQARGLYLHPTPLSFYNLHFKTLPCSCYLETSLRALLALLSRR